MFLFGVFFFKQKTAYEMRISDWSSDVCSSDLEHFSQERDPNVWKALLYRLGNAGGLAPQVVSDFLRKLFERFHRFLLLERLLSFLPMRSAGKIGRASCRERVGQYG